MKSYLYCLNSGLFSKFICKFSGPVHRNSASCRHGHAIEYAGCCFRWCSFFAPASGLRLLAFFMPGDKAADSLTGGARQAAIQAVSLAQSDVYAEVADVCASDPTRFASPASMPSTARRTSPSRPQRPRRGADAEAETSSNQAATLFSGPLPWREPVRSRNCERPCRFRRSPPAAQ